jgi:hypothetical protein
MIGVFRNAQEGFAETAPCIGDDPEVPDIGFYALQEHGAISRNRFHRGKIRNAVSSEAPSGKTLDRH